MPASCMFAWVSYIMYVGEFHVIIDISSPESCCVDPITKHPPDVGLMLVQRLRRQPNIKPTSGGCLVCSVMDPLWRQCSLPELEFC